MTLAAIPSVIPSSMPYLNPIVVKAAYYNLQREYFGGMAEREARTKNHSRTHTTLEKTDEGIPSNYFQVMTAQLTDGTCGSHTLHLNKANGDMEATTVLHPTDGPPQTIESANLTRLRSAVMAAITAVQLGGITSKTVVGMIGTGRLNLMTARVFQILFGTQIFVIRGSALDRTKNADLFYESLPGCAIVADASEKPASIRNCEIIITATNETTHAGQIEFEDLSGPRLFIAQDSGFLLGPSFRKETDTWADAPEHLLDKFGTEFSWDIQTPLFKCIAETWWGSDDRPKTAYLYGMAMADLVIAQMMRELDKAKFN